MEVKCKDSGAFGNYVSQIVEVSDAITGPSLFFLARVRLSTIHLVNVLKKRKG